MTAKVSSKGWNYHVLDKQEVNDLNEGNVPFMKYCKGKMEWDENKKYLLIPSTGSFILTGKTSETDDEILSDPINHSI